jgi:hypothetical protein
MEALEFIIKLIFGIGVLFLFGYLMSFVTGGISKAFGTTMKTNSGGTIATPTTIDENIQDLKNLKNKFFKKYNELINNDNNNKIGVEEKLKMLADLENLRKTATITEDEFIYLKRDILNKE